MWYRTEFELNVLLIHLYVPEKCLFLSLFLLNAPKVDLTLTRAIGPIIAQSAQFRKIVKKMNIDSCQFFFSLKGSTALIKIMK